MPVLSHRVTDGPGAAAGTGAVAWVIVGLVMLVVLLIGVVIYQGIEILYQWRELAELHEAVNAACTGPAATLDLDSFAALCR